MKKTYYRISILVSLIILLLLYILNSNLVIKSILSYTNLFFEKLFPASFLFFIFSSLLLDYGFIDLLTNTLKLNGSKIYIIIMSLVSGFPSGAKYTKELLEKNIITEKTANYYITFTHFPNPLFVLGTVGQITKNSKLTLYILLALILGNLITSLLIKEKNKVIITTNKTTPTDFSSELAKAITSSLKTLVIIYGTSTFFYLIATITNHYLSLSTYPYILLNGFFDLTKGVTATTLISNDILKSFIILLFISLGGLSIHMQVKSILADTNIKYQNFFKGRLLSTFFTIIIFFLLLALFKN